MTYAQRIELGQIFASGKPESRIFREMFACLAPGHTVKFSVKEVEYYNEVIEGLLYWINRETKELQYKPTSDELAAGIRELSRLVGDMPKNSARTRTKYCNGNTGKYITYCIPTKKVIYTPVATMT